MAFKYDFGYVKEEIQNEYDMVVGFAIYNPKDVGILIRAKNSSYLLNEVKEVFGRYGEKENTDENALTSLEGATVKLAEYCDEVFGEGFYARAFKNCNPLTKLKNNEFFVINVIESILLDVREKAAKREQLEEKYLSGYKNA